MVNGESIIDQIKQDHRELEDYYSKYLASANDETEANKWFHAFVLELSRHAIGEELVLYPLMDTLNEKGKRLAQESREDHEKTKKDLYELQSITNSELFNQKFHQLFAELKIHIDKEEKNDLVFASDSLTVDELEKAGKAFSLKKKIAPTRPHPSIPDKPAALEAILGLLVTPIDKFKDLFTSFPEGVK